MSLGVRTPRANRGSLDGCPSNSAPARPITPDMKSLLSWVVAALVAVVLVGVTDGGGAEAAVDPYWTTCAELAGAGRHQTAVALTERTGLPALTAPQMAAALD